MAPGRSFEFNQAERGRCRPVRWRMGAEMGEEADVRRRGPRSPLRGPPPRLRSFLMGQFSCIRRPARERLLARASRDFASWRIRAF
ncbi:hypothetical protein X989_5654 [Burkholderia pseudomallei MSHR4378]|nr:hypothetical protein X989_5654 [Burkholderia pseudomallei MSHR4378]